MRKEIVLTATALSFSFSAIIESINQMQEASGQNEVEAVCDNLTVWRQPSSEIEIGKATIGIQIGRRNFPFGNGRYDENERRESRYNERSDYLYLSVWSGGLLAGCQLEDESWLMQYRDGPPFILKDIRHPNQLNPVNNNEAYYYVHLGEMEGRPGLWEERWKVDLLAGETVSEGNFLIEGYI